MLSLIFVCLHASSDLEKTQDIGRISQEASPSPTQQGNRASPTQYTEELSSVAINMDNMLSDTENPQGMEMSTMQCVPHPELHLSDEREAEPTGIAPFLPLMNS